MFTELASLIDTRPLTLTVATAGKGRIRVNVVPQELPKDREVNSKIRYSHKSEVGEVPEAAIRALTTPLSLTGTPEEVDAALPKALSEYVESHEHLQHTLDQATEQINTAVKAIDERDKAKSKSKTGPAPKQDAGALPKEEKKPDEGLLALWCKPPAGGDTPKDEAATSPNPAVEAQSQPQEEEEENVG